MKIAYMSQHFYPEFIGGAEIASHYIIEKGRKLGHEIDELKEYKPGYDFYIVSNWHWVEPNPELYNQSYVYYCHDTIPIDKFEHKLLENSKVNVFISPNHYEWAKQNITSNFENYFLQPAPMKKDFYIAKNKKDIIVYVGLIASHKGIFNIINYAKEHPEKEFEIYGRSDIPMNYILDVSPPNIIYFGEVSHDKIVNVLAYSKELIYLPKCKDPYGRIIIEALLSGCELIVNENVWIFSYDWDFNNKEFLKNKLFNADLDFWKNLEKYL